MDETIINDLPENILSQLAVYEEKLQTIHEKVETRLKEIDENISLRLQSLKKQAGMDTDQTEASQASTETQNGAVPNEGQASPKSEDARLEGEFDTGNTKDETNQDTLETLNEQGLERIEGSSEENPEDRIDGFTELHGRGNNPSNKGKTDLDEAAPQEPDMDRDNSSSSAEPL